MKDGLKLRTTNKSLVMIPIFLITLLQPFLLLAQAKTAEVDVNVDGNGTDSGVLGGSPWIWIVLVAVFIIVIVALTRGRKDA